MEIIPAIDISEGKCVRLLQGDPRRKIVYADDPVAVAKRWIGVGARRLHVVDLDGAFAGRSQHLGIIEAIAQLGVALQVGGGFRTLEDLDVGFARGADRLIIGTAAPGLAEAAAARFGDRIAVSIDTKDGETAVQGWTTGSGFTPVHLAIPLVELGVRRFIYTDVARDGMLTGPAVASLLAFVGAVRVPVIAAGGVASPADVEALRTTGVEGVIIGRALYEGLVDFRKMLAGQGSSAC
jgi:phosphoribosylformimino-5-aminoimidazole carboxamide ribotide isomerase